MDIKKLSDEFSVTSQIDPGDLVQIAALGFKSVMCNRPNAEAPDQPTFEQIEKAAAAVGLATCHFPVVSGKVGEANVAALDVAASNLAKPILAYCRTGTRSSQLRRVGHGRSQPARART